MHSETDIGSLTTRLRAALPLVEDTAEEYLRVVNLIVDSQNPSGIAVVLSTIDDRCPLGGVMQAALDALEDYPADTYAQALLSCLPDLHRRSPMYAELEVSKFLHSTEDQRALAEAVSGADSQTVARLRTVLQNVASENRDLGEVAMRVLGLTPGDTL